MRWPIVSLPSRARESMSSLALDVFERLIDQVDQIESAAIRSVADGHPNVAPILRRSGLVLAVASIDTFFHEHAASCLYAAALRSPVEAAAVANYCKNVSAANVAGLSGEGYIRMQLSYKTLVASRGIDMALTAAGVDCEAIWRDTAFALNTRPDRLRIQLDLFYDRRNQIAHEGDWDLVQLEFRNMEQAHLADCVRYLRALARTIDQQLC